MGCGVMHNRNHEFHLSCGCHNVAADPLIKMAAKAAAPIETLIAELEAIAASAVSQEAGALIVHHNGGRATIRPLTQGDAEATVEAFGVVGDAVVAVGTLADVTAQVEKQAAGAEIVIQPLAAGQCVIPGLIEPHVHIVPTAMILGWQAYSPFGDQSLDVGEQPDNLQILMAQNLRPGYTLDNLKKRLKMDVDKVPSGEWLLGAGVDTSMIHMASDPTEIGTKTLLNMLDCSVLDQISKTTPILLLSASEHTIYANTKALTLTWERDSDNLKSTYNTLDDYISKTNGVLQEIPQMLPAIEAIPTRQLDAITDGVPERIAAFFEAARRRGVTMVYDAGMQKEMAQVLLRYLLRRRRLHFPECMRIGMAHLVENNDDVKVIEAFTLPEMPSECFDGSINFYFGSVKVVSDGSNQGLTGYQSKPYCCPPAKYYGMNNYVDNGALRYNDKPDSKVPVEFFDLTCAISQKGWPAMIHANGDQSIDYALDAYTGAYDKARPNADPNSLAPRTPEEFKALRNRIEHCSLLNDSRLERINDLGISPSFLIGHVGYWGWAFSDYIFKDKAKKQLDRCASTEMPFTLHSDCSVSPLGPLRMMEQAVTRKMEGWSGAWNKKEFKAPPVLNEAERISPARALRAATFDAAWQCHADHLVGSLEVGKLADFVVLAHDPVSMSADEAYMVMRNIAVQQVWIGGKSVLG